MNSIKMKGAVQNIPDYLIFEMDGERPIYYKGYKEYLTGNKQIEELIGSSYLPSLIITKLVFLLMSHLDNWSKAVHIMESIYVNLKELIDIEPTQ